MTNSKEKNLKRLRVIAGLETKEAAALLNISLSLLYKLEQGYRKPSREIIDKMRKLYKCSTDEIFLAINITYRDKSIAV
jgi:putative transcriptional regulator